MAWTWNRLGRRDAGRRHRPGIEHLDERCLLSTAAPRLHYLATRAESLQRGRAAKAALAEVHAQKNRSQVAPVEVKAAGAQSSSAAVEKPTGSVVTGKPTAFDPIIGAAESRSAYGVDGSGMTVAVIDTGVDYYNSALGGSFGPGSKVVAGYNFATNSSDPLATASQHGTAVAGLIGSSDPSNLGVAPGVNIVALRVVGDNNTASLNDVARALQWVIDNHAQYNITVVNMSLSDGGNYAQNWFAQDGGVGQQITSLVGKLAGLSIPVVAATGNSFNGQQGEGFTSIISGVISVTATDFADRLLPDAQRLGAAVGMGTGTEIAAPGKGLVAPSGDNQYVSVDGTSFAAPLVSGSVVLLQQVYKARFGTLPTVDQVTQWLEKGSDPVLDAATGITIGRLDLPKALSLIPAPRPSPTSTPVATPPPAPAAAPVAAPPPAAQAAATPVAPGSTVLAAPAVALFVNGKPLESSNPSPPSELSALNKGRFDSLVKAMSAWASQPDGSKGTSQVSQVRIWKATSQAAAGIATGTAYPTGRLAARMVRPRRFWSR